MTIPEAQKLVDSWIKKYGVRYFNELTNLALLVEEVGELARLIAREYGEQSYKTSDSLNNINDEMADILFVLICMANQMNIDLDKAFADNLEKKTRRDIDRHRNNPRLK
jgi:NTP pyrophosphatase (non-canonical NTP hydrolase)